MTDTIQTVQLSLPEMLELVASGANGSEYVDLPPLLDRAAARIRELEAALERVKDVSNIWGGTRSTEAPHYRLSECYHIARKALEGKP